MRDWTLTITRPCQSCTGGKEKPFHQWCQVCGASFSQRELVDYAPFMRDTDPDDPYTGATGQIFQILAGPNAVYGVLFDEAVNGRWMANFRADELETVGA